MIVFEGVFEGYERFYKVINIKITFARKIITAKNRHPFCLFEKSGIVVPLGNVVENGIVVVMSFGSSGSRSRVEKFKK